MKNIRAGLAAGAVGTTALNMVTYLDMALRGRPASKVPEEAVKRFGESARISLAPQEGQPKEQQEKARNRQTALGSLSGFATGLTVGGIYGTLRARSRSDKLLAPALMAGLGAMAFSDVPLMAARLTNPREWSLEDWAADLVPHLAYGLFTALTFDALTR